MGNIKNRTAVDYLFEKLFDNYESLHHGKIELHTFFELNMKNRDKAKKMEHEQIVNAWKEDRVMVFFDDKDDDLSEEDIQELAKKYYEETYGN